MTEDGFVKEFQSTPPMQGETELDNESNIKLAISIHSPYAGGDLDRLTF